MKNKYKLLSLVILLFAMMISCDDEETRFIDPMINGISDRTDDAVEEINNSGSWAGSLFGFKEQRIKLLGIKDLIETGSYSGDNYGLQDTEKTSQRVEESIQNVEFLIDSVWGVNLKDSLNLIDHTKAGIVRLGNAKYNEAKNIENQYYEWILADEIDSEGPTTNDLTELQEDVSFLLSLSKMDEDEVNTFVDGLIEKFAEMEVQYADLASEVTTSVYFSKAQKALYSSLEQSMAEMKTTLDGDISLDSKDRLDLIDRDLSALVYFVDNNYTSPAQKPLVFGEISSITELRWLSELSSVDDLSTDWILTSDIDAAESHRWNDGAGYAAIPEFSGTFDGQYHIISGLKVGNTTTKSGFIGYLNATGVVKNLGIYNADGEVVGGQGAILVGQVKGGTIENCFAHGINKTIGQSGGLTGRCDGATISNCFSAVELQHQAAKKNNIGGIFGIGTGMLNLTNVYVTGAINNGPGNTGAIAGNITQVTSDPVLSGVYFDSSTVGVSTGGNAKATAYNPLMVDLPTANWGDLANFSGYSSDVWEIKTVNQIDTNARPYLKGFNYAGIEDFIVP